MAQQNINYGAFPNDPSSNTIRDAFIATQDNFTQLFTSANVESNVSSIVAGTGIAINPANGVGNVTVSSTFNSLRVRSNTISVSSLGGTTDGNTIVIPNANATLILEISSNTNANSSLYNLTVAGNLTLTGNVLAAGNANINLTNGNITLSNGSVTGKLQARGGSGAIQFSDANAHISGSSSFNYDTALNKLTVPAIAVTQVVAGTANATTGIFANLSANTLTVANIVASANISANNITIGNTISAATISGNLTGNLIANALPNSVIFFSATGVSTGSANLTYNGTNLAVTGGAIVCANIVGNLTGTASLATNIVNPVQANITELGNLNFVNVFGNAIVNQLDSNSSVTGVTANFVSANISNTLSATNITATQANLQLDLTARNVNANANISAPLVTATTGTFATQVSANAVVFNSQASYPVSPVPGMVYYNGSIGKLQVYNGLISAWQDLN